MPSLSPAWKPETYFHWIVSNAHSEQLLRYGRDQNRYERQQLQEHCRGHPGPDPAPAGLCQHRSAEESLCGSTLYIRQQRLCGVCRTPWHPGKPEGQGWASGRNYGQKIINILSGILSIKVSNKASKTEKESATMSIIKMISKKNCYIGQNKLLTL